MASLGFLGLHGLLLLAVSQAAVEHRAPSLPKAVDARLLPGL
jgi:hypothetical protein